MFKDKTSKKRAHYNKDLSTLDAMHNKVMNDYSIKIQEEKINLKRIKELEELFNNINKQIIQYNKSNEISEFDNYYNDLWSSNIKIKEDIIKLKEEVKNLNNNNEIEYYENTSYILFNYYDMIEKQSNIKTYKYKNKSIIELFNPSSPVVEEDDKIIEKSSLVDEYLAITNNNHIKKVDESEYKDICRNCSNPLTFIQQDAIMIC